MSDVRLQKRNFGRKQQINVCPKLGFDVRNFGVFNKKKLCRYIIMKISTTSRAGIYRMFYHNRTATNNRICTGALEVSRSSKVRAVDGTTLAATTPTPTLLSPWSKAVRAVIHSRLAI